MTVRGYLSSARALIVGGFSFGLVCGCGDQRADLSLRTVPAVKEEAASAELKVRVLDTTTGLSQDITLSDLMLNATAYPSGGQYTCGTDFITNCELSLCWADQSLARARGMMALTRPQSGPVKLGQYEVPGQPPEVRAAAAYLAWQQAGRVAASEFFAEMNGFIGFSSQGVYCSPAEIAETYTAGPYASLGGTQMQRLAFAAASYVEAYHLSREAADTAIEEMINAGDAGVTTPVATASPCQPETSRRGAAQFIAGGRDMFPGTTMVTAHPPATLCPSKDLSSDGRSALAILRTAGQWPENIKGSIPIGTLLNGDVTGPPGTWGSARQRLAEFYQYAPLAGTSNATTVEQFFNLQTSAFQEARDYLRQELKTFQRQSTSLPAATLPGGATAAYPVHLGTAAEPRPLEAAYYLTLSRSPSNLLGITRSSVDPPPLNTAACGSVMDSVDWMLSSASWILSHPPTDPTQLAAFKVATAPLALLTASNDRTARLDVTRTPTNGTATVHGFGSADGLKLVAGELGLQCATTGKIEGARCTSLAQLMASFTTAATPRSGFAVAATTGTISVPDGYRLYVVKPFRNFSAPLGGDYEVITGVDPTPDGRVASNLVPTTPNYAFSVPVVPELQERLKGLLAPSPKNCSHPKKDCAGGDFDERIPLENELSSDQDGVESSWRHYLTLARNAANLADSIGTDYINSGLDQSRRTEELELRKEQQRERAEDSLEAVRDACGSDLDLTALQGFITDQNTVDIAAIAAANPENASIQRVADCLSTGAANVEAYVSFGSKPLCFWSTSKNTLCQPTTPIVCPTTACPTSMRCVILEGQTTGTCQAPPGRCPTIKPDNLGCSQTYPTGSIPAGATVFQSSTLGYFDTPAAGSAPWIGGPPSAGAAPLGRCEALAIARQLGDNAEYTKNQGIIEGGDFLNPITLKAFADRLDWEARYGGYAALYVGNSVKWQTGSIATGPAAGTWPCYPNGQTSFPGVSYGLFSKGWNCSNDTERAKANYAMLSLVAAAKVMTDDGLGKAYKLRAAPTLLPDNTNLQTAPYDVQTFWSPSFAVRRYAVDDWFAYRVDPACTGAPCVRWFRPDGSQPIAPGTAMRMGPVEFVRSVYTGTDKGPKTGPIDVARDLLRYGINYSSKASWNASFLPFKDSVLTQLVGISTPGVKPYLNLYGTDFTGALEVMCQVSQAPPRVDLGVPPKITSIDDLPAAAEYISRQGEVIRDSASLTLLANMPKKVADALREESVTGAYPQFGGAMAQQISTTRQGLLKVREMGPAIGQEFTQLGYELGNLHKYLQQNANQANIADLQFLANRSEQMARCGASIANAGGGVVSGVMSAVTDLGSGFARGVGEAIAAAITCANSVAQINFADGIRNLQVKDTQLQSEIVIGNFGSQFSTHATNLQTYALRIQEGFEDVDAGLAGIERLRDSARRALSKGIYLSGYQARSAAEVTFAMNNLYHGKQQRYTAALANAKRLSLLAKRAIEQRLGMSLSSMTEDLPLVEAPSTWENSVCEFGGLDYDKLLADNPDAQPGGSFYAEGFIGDYVTKLENVVESYSLVHNFHEGSDTAVVSLKNDVMGVKVPCSVQGPNLLYFSNNLQTVGTPGWTRQNCKTTTENSQTVMAADCITVIPQGVPPTKFRPELETFQIKFGAGVMTGFDTALMQTVNLTPGRYRFSWYTKDAQTDNGGASGLVKGTGVTTTAGWIAGSGTEWSRAFLEFTISTQQDVKVGFWNYKGTSTPVALTTINVGAPMLERLPTDTYTTAATPFSATAETLDISLPKCEDVSGTTFRSKWTRDCLTICANGFSDTCAGGDSARSCFYQTKFDINQSDLQFGRLMQYGGFAKGNFNYRIHSLALNFVGTAVRDCTIATVTQPCYSAGFVPYSIDHTGPFFVRNDAGNDFKALLFDGHIEHARGLALERYLTNPVSSTDRGLLQDYTRMEFQGRPLDGTFVVRVWDDPGFDFNSIQDVQILLNYGYWTRFN